jgi:hypothetical protein
MHTFPAVPWLTDWKRTGVEPFAQREYVKSELQRIAALGAPVLSMVLTAPLEIQTQLAMSLLHERALATHRYWLRLIPGAKPPVRDPQGRELQPPERGEILVAKIGTKGGQLNHSSKLPSYVTEEFTGPNVQIAAAQERDIYHYARIGRDAVELSLSDAVLVLRRYGWQIAHPRMIGKSRRVDEKGNPSERDAEGRLVQPIDFWLVEEIPPAFVNNDGTVRDPKATAPQHNNPKRAA